MWLYIRNIFQLILSPGRGWEDVSESTIPPEEIQKKGFYPWLAVASLSEFVRMFYVPNLGFATAFESAIAVAVGMFGALYVARVFLDMTLTAHVDGTLDVSKVSLLTTYMLGIACLFQIISNVVPTNLTLIYILPILSLLVLFKAIPYMTVRSSSPMTFLFLGAVATIFIPMSFTALLRLIIA